MGRKSDAADRTLTAASTFSDFSLTPQTTRPFCNTSMASNKAAKDDDWEKAEGVPSLSEPFIQKYLSGRDALVQQEKKQRSGWWSKRRIVAQYYMV